MKQMHTSKKVLLSASLLASFPFFLYSCQKNVTANQEAKAPALVQVTQRTCASTDVLQRQLAQDPSLRERMNSIEAFTQSYIAGHATNYSNAQKTSLPTTITVPVVVNVVYNTASQNISDAQIQSQIAVLNEDYNKANADTSNTPALFKPNAANVNVKFQLMSTVRQATSATSFSSNDAVKSTTGGGVNPTNPTRYLNIWVCNLGGGLLGYSQFPGGSSATDGIVILYSAFGRTGTLISRFNLGRTASHEIGHWMNLRHIWGDAQCGDDLVSDTPTADGANSGLPTFPKYSTCTGTPVEMTMDYMDYTDDAGMNMFSAGQKSRMQAVFASGGPRAAYHL